MALLAEVVVADGADYIYVHPVAGEFGGCAGEVGRGAAELGAVGEDVPEDFSECDDGGAVGHWLRTKCTA